MATPTQTQTPSQQTKKQNESNTSRIDLNNLTLRELIALRDQVDAALADIYSLTIRDDDAVLEYNVSLRTHNGLVSRNAGSIQMNKLFHPRLIAESPERFEQQFTQQVYAPMSAALYDLLDECNPTEHSIHHARNNFNEPLPALPTVATALPDSMSV